MMTEQSITVAELKALFRVWQRNMAPSDDYFHRVLQTGLDWFGLDVGIVSHIQDKHYVVAHSCGGELTQGQNFELGDTYCAITLSQLATVGIHHMQISEHARHPCYQAFQLEAYIGTPIYLHGLPYGTVNFSSPNKRDEPFSRTHFNAIYSIGRAVEWGLAQARTLH